MLRRLPKCCCFALALAAGCMTFSAKPDLHLANKTGAAPYPGKVYLFRGVGGVFSIGMDALAKQLTSIGVSNEVEFHPQWWMMADRIAKEREKLAGPLILVGHSYGSDAALRLAQKLDARNVPVDLIVTIDPVTPPNVPKNVKHVINIYRDNGVVDAVPFWRGMPLAKAADAANVWLENVHVQEHPDLNLPGLTHANIDDNPIIQQEVIRRILLTCKAK
jgi:pimeloyl-ACP methyl ester carboxylesterase